MQLDLGHGFVPRIDKRNWTGVDSGLGRSECRKPHPPDVGEAPPPDSCATRVPRSSGEPNL